MIWLQDTESEKKSYILGFEKITIHSEQTSDLSVLADLATATNAWWTRNSTVFHRKIDGVTGLVTIAIFKPLQECCETMPYTKNEQVSLSRESLRSNQVLICSEPCYSAWIAFKEWWPSQVSKSADQNDAHFHKYNDRFLIFQFIPFNWCINL